MNFRLILVSSTLIALPGIAFSQNQPQAVSVTAASNSGLGVANAVELQGVVMSIDAANRMIEIKGGTGREYLVEVGSDVKNFNQIKVNDVVTISMLEAVALELKKSTSGLREKTEKTEVTKAPIGSKPGAQIVHRVTVVADIIAIDQAKQQVSLRGPKRIIDLVVADARKLASLKVGDQVEATYATGVAVSVTAAK